MSNALYTEALRRADGDYVRALVWLAMCWRLTMDAIETTHYRAARKRLEDEMNEAERTVFLVWMAETYPASSVVAIRARHERRHTPQQVAA